MLLQGYVSNTDDNYTQNYDKNGNIYYTDENGRVVDFKVNPFVKLANKVKATAINIGNWLNESNPNSEAYKQKVGLVAGLVTAPLGIGELATAGVTRALAPYVGRKIAQNMATGLGSGVVGGGVSGGLEAGLNNENILAGGLKGATIGGLLGGLGGYGLGKVGQKLNTQTAWHGSPYKFNKFSNEAIGTGEGAQAHGYGHYAAKNKNVAQGYADRLGGYEYNGKPITSNSEEDLLLNEILNEGYNNTLTKYQKDFDDMQEIAKNWEHSPNDYNAVKEIADKLASKIDTIKNIDTTKIKRSNSNLYKLSIPKDDVMLREYASFSEQPAKVQKALTDIQNEEIKKSGFNSIEEVRERLNAVSDEYEKAIREQAAPIWAWGSTPVSNYQLELSKLERLNDMFGYGGSSKNIYDNFAKRLGKEKASQLFNQHGIKGISYNGGIDGEARVIFNPDDIDIIPYYDNPTSFKEKFINLLSR